MSDGLILSDESAVDAERQRLAATPALAALCRHKRFDGVDEDVILNDIVLLMLYDAADRGQHSAPAIKVSRYKALADLAEHFSPMGQDELLQTLNADIGDYVLSDYLSKTDTLGLAAHVCRAQAMAAHCPESLLRAADLCVSAAEIQLQMKRTMQAAQNYIEAAQHYWTAGEYELGAQVHEQAMKIYHELPLDTVLAFRYWQAASAWAKSNAPCKHLHMTAAYLAAANVFMELKDYEEAQKSLDDAIKAWRARDVPSTPLDKVGDIMKTVLKFAQGAAKARQHALARAAFSAVGQEFDNADAWQSAAESSEQDYAFRAAASAYGSEAECRMLAGQYELAKIAFEKSAQAYYTVGAQDLANQARAMAKAARRFASSPIGSYGGFA